MSTITLQNLNLKLNLYVEKQKKKSNCIKGQTGPTIRSGEVIEPDCFRGISGQCFCVGESRTISTIRYLTYIHIPLVTTHGRTRRKKRVCLFGARAIASWSAPGQFGSTKWLNER